MAVLKSNLTHVDLSELFRLPDRSRIAAFAEAQVSLYRNDPTLQDYFLPLQLNFGLPNVGEKRKSSIYGRALSQVWEQAYKLARPIGQKKYKADVLFCPMPYFQRQTENRFLQRILMGLAESDRTILCFLSDSAPCKPQILEQLAAAGRSRQVTLLDPVALLNPLAVRLYNRAARDRGRSAFSEISQILRPFGLNPPQESEGAYEHIAQFVEAWLSIEDYLEFDSVVARCHWHALCSPVCRAARQRGKPVITFQQGVIDHTLDVPVTASHYIAFGRSSATFLESMNHKFFQAVGNPCPATEFVPGGCLYDTLLELPNQFSNSSLLVIDDPDPNGFYGVNIDSRGVLKTVQNLLRSATPLKRVIIRPHPHLANLELEPWKQLVREHPDSCQLSSSAWSLEDDFRRVSAVVGTCSGALTAAAASGLPAIFLETDSYTTGDLACFRPGQTFNSDDALREIARVLTDAQAYAEARIIALRNAREYYANGSNLNLGAEFFGDLLGTKHVGPQI